MVFGEEGEMGSISCTKYQVLQLKIKKLYFYATCCGNDRDTTGGAAKEGAT